MCFQKYLFSFAHMRHYLSFGVNFTTITAHYVYLCRHQLSPLLALITVWSLNINQVNSFYYAHTAQMTLSSGLFG